MEMIENDSLFDLNSISDRERELLVAIGLTKVSQLRNYSLESLVDELSKANEKLKILAHDPTAEEINSWWPENSFLFKEGSGYSQEPQTLSLEEEVYFAPLAHVVSLSKLKEAQLDLDQIPRVEEVKESDHFIYCTDDNRPSSKTLNESINQILGEDSNEATSAIDGVAQDNLENLNIERSMPKLLSRKLQSEGGRSKSMGVSDPNAFDTYLGAFFTIMTTLSMYVAILSSCLIIFYKQEKWFFLGIIAFACFIVLYVIWSQKARCCVCNKKQFVRQKRTINKKVAHKFPLISYVTSTAIHAVVLGRFRCITCGSSICLFDKKNTSTK